MNPTDRKELEEALNKVDSMVKASKLAFDGACRNGDLRNTQLFAEHLHTAAGLFLELVASHSDTDAIIEGSVAPLPK